MRKFVNKVFITTSNKVAGLTERVGKVMKSNSGEGFVDTAVKILMAVVIGALVLSGLYLLFKNTVLPTLTQKITDMFNFNGQ